jgi:hypothetical protein
VDWPSQRLTNGAGTKAKGILLPVRQLQQWIEHKVLLLLKQALFNKRDSQLVSAAGSCFECPKHPATTNCSLPISAAIRTLAPTQADIRPRSMRISPSPLQETSDVAGDYFCAVAGVGARVGVCGAADWVNRFLMALALKPSPMIAIDAGMISGFLNCSRAAGRALLSIPFSAS